MSSDSGIPSLETLLRKDLVHRPVNALFIKRNYTKRELDTLKCLEPDASKAVGRELSDTERNVLLEHKGNSIASESRPSAFTVSIAVLGGLASTLCTTRVRKHCIRGRSVHHIQIRPLPFRDLVGITGIRGYTALLFKPAESQPLSLEILNDPRMSAFKESIQRRKKEFGGHEPEIVRRKDRNIERPIQWFTNASGPFSLRPYQNSLAVVRLGPRSIEVQEEPLPITDYPDHPDLSWSRNPSSYRKRLRDNELAKKDRVLISIADKHRFLISKGLADKNRSSPWDVDFELCDQHKKCPTFVYNPGPPKPRLYVE